MSRRAFDRRGWTQENLAAEVNLKTRQPIWRFFTSRPIERHTFIEICEVLDLNWWEVVDQDSGVAIDPDHPSRRGQFADQSVDRLVERLRHQHREKVYAQCSRINLLNSNRVLDIDDIYVPVHLMEPTLYRQWREAESRHDASSGSSPGWPVDKSARAPADVFSSEVFQTHHKIRLLGRPGAGKTTLLQYLAMYCIRDDQAHRIPLFISLERVSTYVGTVEVFDLASYVAKELQSYQVGSQEKEALLRDGRFLFLFDGLDEISDRQQQALIAKAIAYFSEDYYKNHFVVTCRTGTQTFQFFKFVDFEISNFTTDQIETFVMKWFAHTQPNAAEGTAQAKALIHELNLPENWLIKEMAQTPLLLSQICLLFQQMGRLRESQALLCRECLDILIHQWDRARGIQRCRDDSRLSRVDELDILSHLAQAQREQEVDTFSRQTIEASIDRQLADPTHDSLSTEVLRREKAAIIESMTAHHGLLSERSRGVYAFSYRAFQEYFAMR